MRFVSADSAALWRWANSAWGQLWIRALSRQNRPASYLDGDKLLLAAFIDRDGIQRVREMLDAYEKALDVLRPTQPEE